MKTQQGFTLIELVTVLSLASVLTVVLLGNYTRLIDDWRDRQAIREAVQLLKLYRLTGQASVAWRVDASPGEGDSLDSNGDGDGDGQRDGRNNNTDANNSVASISAAAQFITLSATNANDLDQLRTRLQALPDNHLKRYLERSAVDGSDPINRYSLASSGGSHAIEVNTRLQVKPYGATPLNQANGRYRLHYRVTRVEQLAYLMPARVERQAFSLAEEPR